MRAKRAASSRRPRSDGLVERVIELQVMAQMQIAKADERMARADERFARLEQENNERCARLEQESNERFQRLEQAIATIMRMLEALPDAVREKMGFATAEPRHI
jgi:hypothetical protein